jgi:hypothetical protein
VGGEGTDNSRQIAADSGQFDNVQSSMFKVPSFLIDLNRIFKLETLNLEL